MRQVAIVGVGIHPFGRFPNKTYVDIAREAVAQALSNAGAGWKQIEAAFCGTVYTGSTAGPRVLSQLGFTGVPIVDVENACASGGSALRLAYQAVAHGIHDLVLALGFEKMPSGFIASPRFELWERQIGFAANPISFALRARRHMVDHGITDLQLAQVSVKNHRNGVHNPNAMYRREMSLEEIIASPMVCDPLRLLMLCAPNEGAAAAIVTTRQRARRFTRQPVLIAGISLRSPTYGAERIDGQSYPTRAKVTPITTAAAREAFAMSGLGPGDLSLVELQDTDSGSEIIACEELGLCPPGEGGRLLDEGATEPAGCIPVNVSGGLLSKGEPVGASALGQVHELVLQLRGQAGPRQVAGARVGMGHVIGAGGNCAVTILKR